MVLGFSFVSLTRGSNLAALPVRRSLPGCAFTLAGCALYDAAAQHGVTARALQLLSALLHL